MRILAVTVAASALVAAVSIARAANLEKPYQLLAGDQPLDVGGIGYAAPFVGDFDVDGQLGLLEINPPAEHGSHGRSQFPLDLRRRQWKPLVGPSCGDAEARRRLTVQIAQNRRREIAEIRPCAARLREVGDTEDAGQPLPNGIPRRFGSEHHLDSSHQRANRPDVEIAHGTPDMAGQPRNEPWPVAALQRNLLIVDDDGSHGSGAV